MDYLKQNLSENLLVLLCFGKEEDAKLIVSNVTPNLFDNKIYRDIAHKAIEFFKKFGSVVGGHLPELLEDELKDESKSQLYQKVIENIYNNSENINSTYVINDLNNFIRMQQMKIDVKETAELLQKGRIDEAESKLYNSRKKRIEIFDAGIFFGVDKESTLGFKKEIEQDQILTGIPALDKLGHVPTKGELYTLMGRSGDGKSWFLIHLAKKASQQRKKVLHISLEMGYKRLLSRYAQSYWGLGTKKESLNLKNAFFKEDDFGFITSINFKTITKNIKLIADSDVEEYLSKKIDIMRNPNLVIKCFPSGSLTIEKLEAYLDNLEAYKGFIPDIILLDYLDLMAINSDNKRNDLGRVGVELRGIAGNRNLAMVNVSQTNRVAEGAKVLTRRFLGEDFSKVQTTDVFITTNKTAIEKELGLMRIYVDKGRNDKDGDLIVCSQNLSIGRFIINSSKMENKYYDILEDIKNNNINKKGSLV